MNRVPPTPKRRSWLSADETKVGGSEKDHGHADAQTRQQSPSSDHSDNVHH
jgi:hypothetical protein